MIFQNYIRIKEFMKIIKKSEVKNVKEKRASRPEARRP